MNVFTEKQFAHMISIFNAVKLLTDSNRFETVATKKYVTCTSDGFYSKKKEKNFYIYIITDKHTKATISWDYDYNKIVNIIRNEYYTKNDHLLSGFNIQQLKHPMVYEYEDIANRFSPITYNNNLEIDLYIIDTKCTSCNIINEVIHILCLLFSKKGFDTKSYDASSYITYKPTKEQTECIINSYSNMNIIKPPTTLTKKYHFGL